MQNTPIRALPKDLLNRVQGDDTPRSALTLLVTVQIDDLLQANGHGIVPVHTGTEKERQL